MGYCNSRVLLHHASTNVKSPCTAEQKVLYRGHHTSMYTFRRTEMYDRGTGEKHMLSGSRALVDVLPTNILVRHNSRQFYSARLLVRICTTEYVATVGWVCCSATCRASMQTHAGVVPCTALHVSRDNLPFSKCALRQRYASVLSLSRRDFVMGPNKTSTSPASRSCAIFFLLVKRARYNDEACTDLET